MDSPKKEHRSGYGRNDYRYSDGSNYGYGSYGSYGNYGYGSYGYGSETTVERTLKDYLLILRERAWYIVITFLVVFTLVLAYTLTQTPIFQSTTTVEVFRRAPMVMQVQQVIDSQINSAEDLNTQVNILKSDTIIERVADRLKGNDLKDFLAPYATPGRPVPKPEGILAKNRDIVPQRLSLVIDVDYRHPNKFIAAKVANLFADEYFAYNAHIQVDESMKAVEELEFRANEQKKKVDDIAGALQTYREKNNLVSLDQRKDIVTERLKDLSSLVTKGASNLQEAQTRWNQVQAFRRSGANPLDLPFIASVPAVSQLQQQVATFKISVAQLSQRYRSKHPQMIAAVDSLKQAEDELRRAIETTTAQIQSEYQSASQNYQHAQSELASQETDSLRLDRYGLEYSNLERDYDVNEKLLEHILERTRETSMSSSVENQNARIIDRALPGIRPVSPNYKLNLSLGVFAGLGLGLAFAFFAAYVDDRIKSAYDIETVVGLPILGVIPEVKNMGSGDRVQLTVGDHVNREMTEAFSSILSSLQLKDESKKAQCILVTSTIASEGKSFIATNLASTYAAHGERVLILDCDLRRPAVNRRFHLENLKGVIDVCASGMSLDDAIVKDVQPNLDVLPTGGRSKNPTQTLHSKEFAIVISELRKRYDRIFVDTPPVAIVSDALIILPLMDGSLYTIFFNKVRRKATQFCAQKIIGTNVPCFGAVLNGLSGGIGGYYYSHYYAKSYKDYYITKSELNGGGTGTIEEKPGKTRV